MRARLLAAATLGFALMTRVAVAQFLSDLEPERPLLVEDARPVSYRAISGSADWSYTLRKGSLNDYGPGFSLLYGLARGLETGAAVQYVTRPERNSERGISSGDLLLHALYQIADETAARPAIAFRAAVQFPTGLASKGTDLQLTGLATRSFDSFRLHLNVRYERLGDTNPMERHNRYDVILGADCIAPGRRDLTDTLLITDAALRSNPVIGAPAILLLEVGVRHRIGPQTFFFAGAGSEITGLSDRARMRLRIGLTHVY